MKQYQELSGKHEKTQLICDLDKQLAVSNRRIISA